MNDDKSFELVPKVSELIQELINISMSHATEKIKLRHYPLTPPNYIEKTNIAKNSNPMPSSSVSQTSTNIIEDIYSRAAFCDENICHAHSGQVVKDININKNETCALQNQTQVEHIRNRSGFINVALTSTNKTDSDLGSPRNLNFNNIEMRDMTTPNRSDRESTIIRFNNKAGPSNQETDGFTELSERMTREELHEYYVQVFRNHCKELPIIATTLDLAELAREGVLHNILKIFFMLQQHPDIENDYRYFEICLEDEIDGLLDLLPQTEEMKKIREGWKSKLLMHAIQMLKHIHKIKDDTQFMIKINRVLNRFRLIQESAIENNEAQQLNALRTAENFLVSTNYQEQNPLKVKIYVQRLMNYINQVYNMVKKSEGKSFLLLPIDEINDVIYEELKNVPIPNDDITKEEIDLVHLNDEIEKWYNELPIEPAEGSIAIKRKILTLTLSKKIHEMDMHMDLNEPSIERNMKHEISKFLSTGQAGLERDEDLNINFMVEELANRLRKIRQEKMLDYESFTKHLPFSSTIVQHDQFNQGNVLQSNEEVQFNGQNQLSNSHDILKETKSINKNEENIMKLEPIARSTVKGILGKSQLPGPNTRGDHLSSPVCGPKACQTRISPKTASLFTPSSSSPARNTSDAGQFHGISEIEYTSPTQSTSINTNRRINNLARFNQLQQQKPDNDSIRDSDNRHTNELNNDIHLAKQEDGRLPSIGPTHGTASTANVAPGISQDCRNILHIDSDRDREQNRTRCRCAEGVSRRRKRFMCCCEKYVSMPYCCVYPFPYDHFL
ncbi:unnamed protein product [Parnassius apollo]|uniref:(apollo) hypothetical protein n=1 Tax=Parnassius apollo TaxID=110799 RepID=A0A8S3X695_PARAO|nr:unnamed protein product [Parnassius apollo]